MTAQQKTDVSWFIKIITGIIVITGFAFGMGSGFTKNTEEHKAIGVRLDGREDSDDADRRLILDMKKTIDRIDRNQLKIMTTLDIPEVAITGDLRP